MPFGVKQSCIDLFESREGAIGERFLCRQVFCADGVLQPVVVAMIADLAGEGRKEIKISFEVIFEDGIELACGRRWRGG